MAFASSALLGFRVVEFTTERDLKYIDGSELENLPPATSAAVGKSLVWVSDRDGATFDGLTFRHTGFELAVSLCAKLGRETAVRG